MRNIGVRQIARLAGVSTATVDRALNDRKGISDSTRRQILAIAERIGYRPDPAAQALSAGRVPIKLGVCIPQQAYYYFDQLRRGIFTEARRLERLGLQLVYRPTTAYGVDQVARVSELLDSGVRGLLIAPGDPVQLTPLIDEAEKRNVRVICLDSDAPTSRRSTVVRIDVEVVGKMAAELMCGFVDPKSDVAIIGGLSQVEAHAKKNESFCALYSQLSGGGKVATIIEVCGGEQEAFQACFKLLQDCKSLAGLYVNTAANCLPVCQAIWAHGLSGKITLITTDLFRSMAPYFENGTIRASIHQRPFTQGATAVRLLADHFVNARPLPRTYYLVPQIALRSNIHLFRDVAQTLDQADQILPDDRQAHGPVHFPVEEPQPELLI